MTAEVSRTGIGREAERPKAIPVSGWLLILKRTVKGFFADRVMLISAGVTLYMLIALVPSLSTIVSIYGLFSRPETIPSQVSLFQGMVPAGGLDLIRSQLERIASQSDQSLGWTLVVGLAIAIWSASLGINGMFDAMNVAYGETEKRGPIKRIAVVLSFTVAASILAVVALVVVVVLPAVLTFLPIISTAGWAVRLLSFALLGALLLVGLAALYRWGPSRKDARWTWITPGAIFAIVVVLIISVLFSWYVANFGNYSATYGSLGALIGFLTWMWFSTIAVVTGGKLNAEIERQTAVDSTTPPTMPMGKRGAHVADTLGS